MLKGIQNNFEEYSKYGYSAASICEDTLDKIFVVAADKYELTSPTNMKRLRNGSALVAMCSVISLLPKPTV